MVDGGIAWASGLPAISVTLMSSVQQACHARECCHKKCGLDKAACGPMPFG